MADVKSNNTIEIVEQKEAKPGNENVSNNITFDEYLARTVRKFPVIYDKSCKDFHERDVKDSAWHAVAIEVGLHSGGRIFNSYQKFAKYTLYRNEKETLFLYQTFYEYVFIVTYKTVEKHLST